MLFPTVLASVKVFEYVVQVRVSNAGSGTFLAYFGVNYFSIIAS